MTQPMKWIAPTLLSMLGSVSSMTSLAASSTSGGAARPPALDEAAAARFAGLALTCLHQEYPNKIAHVMQGDADARPPHELTPAFYGCFDWHSDVHGHWLLVRLVRLFPNAPFATTARARARPQPHAARTSPARWPISRATGRASFERPYGLAWLLQLVGGAARVERPAGARMGGDARAARNRGGRAHQALAAEAALPDPHRRARPDGVLVRADLGLGRRRRR